MPLTPKLNKFSTASPLIATYSATDVADGTGKILVEGLRSTTSAGTDFRLQENEAYSTLIETTATTSSATFTKIIDLDFDLATFNAARALKGTSTFQICAEVTESGSGSVGDRLNAYIIMKVRKWDGSTETEIASVQSQTIAVVVGTNDPKTEILFMSLEIDKTNFAVGDTLRVTVEGWGQARDTKDCRITIGHDPMNRDGTYIVPTTDDPETITTFKSSISLDITE